MQSSVEYLRHCSNVSGVHTTDGKVEAILKPLYLKIAAVKVLFRIITLFGRALASHTI